MVRTWFCFSITRSTLKFCLFFRDHIIGLKLRHIDAYCGSAAVHKGEKESLLFGHPVLCLMGYTHTHTCTNTHTPTPTQLLQYTSCSRRETFIHPRLLQCRSLPWWVKFSLPKCRSLSPFIRSLFLWFNDLFYVFL